MTDFQIRTRPDERAFMQLMHADQFGKYGGLVSTSAVASCYLDGLNIKTLWGKDFVRISTKKALPIQLRQGVIMTEDYLKRHAMHTSARWDMGFGDITFEVNKWAIPAHVKERIPLDHTHLLLINSITIESWQ